MLAISLALFAHSLIGAGVVLLLPERPQPKPIQLDMILMDSGGQPSRARQAIEAASWTSPQPISRQIRPDRIRTSTQSQTKAPDPEKRETPQEHPSAKPQKPDEQISKTTEASKAEKEGKASPFERKDEAEASQLAQPDAAEAPSYTNQLAIKISEEMGRASTQVPVGEARFKAGKVQLQLRLLANGALVNAEIIESSGFEGVDRSYLTAALRASPYPRPPEADRSDGFQYRVNFFYKPKVKN